jgi:hypothetical protein
MLFLAQTFLFGATIIIMPFIDYLIWYNIERVHCAFQNKLSPVQFIIQWQKQKLLCKPLQNQSISQSFKMLVESKIGWHYTRTA